MQLHHLRTHQRHLFRVSQLPTAASDFPSLGVISLPREPIRFDFSPTPPPFRHPQISPRRAVRRSLGTRWLTRSKRWGQGRALRFERTFGRVTVESDVLGAYRHTLMRVVPRVPVSGFSPILLGHRLLNSPPSSSTHERCTRVELAPCARTYTSTCLSLRLRCVSRVCVCVCVLACLSLCVCVLVGVCL